MKRLIFGLAAVALAAAAVPASATVFTFTFTGGVNAVFQIDDATFVPEPRTWDSFQTYQNVSYNGGPAELDYLAFYIGGVGGGVDIFPHDSPNEYGVYSPTGVQVFAGTLTAPTFFTGSFDLYDYFYEDVAYHLDITSNAAPGVPEPASWAMLIAGFGLTGAAMRRRGVRVRVAVA
jgi:hypothetical protein